MIPTTRELVSSEELRVLTRHVVKKDFYHFFRHAWTQLPRVADLVVAPHIPVTCRYLHAAYEKKFDRLLINIPPESLKALAVDTPVLTTWGWKNHGDIQVGDFVFGPDGLPKRVLAATEHSEKPSSKVFFKNAWSDQRFIVAANDHLWQVERAVGGGNTTCNSQHARRRIEVVATDQLRPNGSQKSDRIPVAEPVQLPPKRLLIDPYVLGMWLGDGSSDSGSIYVCDEDKAMVEPYGRLSRIDKADGSRRKQDFRKYLIPELQTKLRMLDVLHNKHIPEDYLESSVEQRWALLQGLMDTDGTCSKDKGGCYFSNKNKAIIDAFRLLLGSLGIKSTYAENYSTCNGKRYGPHYNIGFIAPKGSTIFRLERKQKLVRYPTNETSRKCYVDRV